MGTFKPWAMPYCPINCPIKLRLWWVLGGGYEKIKIENKY